MGGLNKVLFTLPRDWSGEYIALNLQYINILKMSKLVSVVCGD